MKLHPCAASFLFLFVGSLASALPASAGDCKSFRAVIVDAQVTAGCTSPKGFCAAGTVDGGRGDGSVVPAGGLAAHTARLAASWPPNRNAETESVLVGMQRFGIPLILLSLWATFAFGNRKETAPAPAPQQTVVERGDSPEVSKDAPTPKDAAAGPPAASPDPEGSNELKALLAEFVGAKADAALAELLVKVREQWPGYQLMPMLAVVADPLDSQLKTRFDQSLLGLQEAYADSGFLFDSYRSVWESKDPTKQKEEAQAARERPGMILLFRHPEPRELALVFLVGETPKQGIHRKAFLTALKLAQILAPATTVEILGPTFSGSVDSMKAVLRTWKPQHPDPEVGPCWPQPEIQIVSGSATAANLKDEFSELPGVSFERTVSPDNILLARSLRFLESDLGWNLRRVVLLTESDTAYGRSMIPGSEAEHKLKRSHPQLDFEIRHAFFPSGIGELRKAWATKQKAEKSAASATTKNEATNVDLGLSEHPVDLVPELGDLATPAKDLALGNLLQSLCLEDIRYFGIVATDLRDRLFLIQRVRAICPDATLFTLDNDMLLAHPQLGDDLNGTLVFSSMPLFPPVPVKRALPPAAVTRAPCPDGKPCPDPTSTESRRQFIGELHQGTFLATQALLEPPPSFPVPPSWIVAVGNGSLWPIARVPPPRVWQVARALSDRTKMRLLLAGLAILALAGSFRSARRALPAGAAKVAQRIANTVLVAAATVLLTLVALPYVLFRVSDQSGRALDYLLAGSAAFAIGAILYWPPNRSSTARWSGFVLLCTGLLGFGIWSLFNLWMPGGAELFHLRARSFSGGVSPIVSLAWSGAALLAWSWFEIRRRAQAPDCLRWEIQPGGNPELATAFDLAEHIERDASGRFISGPARIWIGLLSVGFLLFFVKIGQVIAERPGALVLFLVLGHVTLLLVVISFVRFLSLWRHLRHLLGLLRSIDLAKILDENNGALRKAIDWKPMKSFALKVPEFRMLQLSSDKLVDFRPDLRTTLSGSLRTALAAHHAGDKACERQAREEIHDLLDATTRSLTKGFQEGSAEQEYLLVRIVAYVRSVFGHLRDSLVAALVPSFLLLAAVETHHIQPKRLLVFGLLAILVAMIFATVWTFAQIERNPVLSTIAGTTGSDALYQELVTTVFSYCVTPVLLLVTTQTPQTRGLILQLLNPLLKAMALPDLTGVPPS
ncbi:MAG TPA: hypothetical protein VGS22_11190 [Thermoanaerobaculia bacterium]|jgi:hypothetical protein|nr:hypothetical protein [Thermoanaerobaculia bacterium]